MFDLLRGIKVLDLTTVLLGPYATRFLGDLGADVIKVEPPGGDVLRYADPGRSEAMGAAYLNCNRNKRSIVLDLAQPEGAAALRRLAGTADVFVHNMRPKSARKLGIDFAQIQQIKSDVVYCYGCGFGQDGRLADEPAYDDVVQALSGLAFINHDNGEEPRYLPNTVCDKVAGLHLALAILAGIVSRQRTGQAVCIEAPMFECTVSFLLLELLAGKSFEPPSGGFGYERLTTPFRRPFRTRDGFVCLLPYTTGHWQRFLQLLGRADVADSDLVTVPAIRSRNIGSLYRLIAEAAPERTTAEWLDLMRQRDIPCADVNRPEDLLSDPHLTDVGLFRTVQHPSEGKLLSIRSPFRVADHSALEDRPASRPGQDGIEVMREAGYGDGEIERAIEGGGLCLPA